MGWYCKCGAFNRELIEDDYCHFCGTIKGEETTVQCERDACSKCHKLILTNENFIKEFVRNNCYCECDNLNLKTQIKILEHSPFNGKKMSELADKYNLTIEAGYGEYSMPDEDIELNEKDVIEAPVYLNIEGEFEDIRRFSLEAVNYKR